MTLSHVRFYGARYRHLKYHMINITINYHIQCTFNFNEKIYARVCKIQSVLSDMTSKICPFWQILLRTDTRLVFCNRKSMRTDILLTKTTKLHMQFCEPDTGLSTLSKVKAILKRQVENADRSQLKKLSWGSGPEAVG